MGVGRAVGAGVGLGVGFGVGSGVGSGSADAGQHDDGDRHADLLGVVAVLAPVRVVRPAWSTPASFGMATIVNVTDWQELQASAAAVAAHHDACSRRPIDDQSRSGGPTGSLTEWISYVAGQRDLQAAELVRAGEHSWRSGEGRHARSAVA